MIASSVRLLTLMRIRAFLPAAAACADRPDLLDQPVAQVERRDEELAELLRPPEAGDVVEEVGDVGGDVLVGGEEPEVLVDAARCARGSCPCRCGRSG